MTEEIKLEQKPFWYSKTIIGAIITALASIAQQTGLLSDPDSLIGLTDEIFQMVGLILVVYGRATAKTSIGMTKVPVIVDTSNVG